MKRILLSIALIAVCVAALAGIPAARAQSGNMWQLDYFNNTDWSGAPAATQWNSLVAFNWGFGSPAPNIQVDNFSGRFTTTAFFYAGTYRFSLVADDEMVLAIDGVTRLDTRGQGQSGKSFNIDIPLSQGNHQVVIHYREFTQTAYIFVNWAFIGGGSPPPSQGTPSPYPPLPPSVSSLTTRFGDYTPCIQQNIHQSNCFVSDGAWNSPNLGSIQMEPQITSWNRCTADQVQMFTNPSTLQPQSYGCSKTEAGWFPR